MLLPLRDAIILDVACALLTYGIYKKFEIEPLQRLATFVLIGAVPFIPAITISQHFAYSASAFFASFSLFYAVIITATVLYRLSPFHTLAAYPGPLPARVSKFWVAWITSRGKNHLYYAELHKRYGPYVRIGPNELSVTDVDAIPSILGADRMPKGPMWSARSHPEHPRMLIGLNVAREHAQRRRAWNHAFNTTAVKGYEPIVAKRSLQLAAELYKRGPGGLDLAQWLNFFAFDFMGDMAFGGGFELMRDGGDEVGVAHMIHGNLNALSIIHHMPWLGRLMFKVPSASKSLTQVRTFASGEIRRRKREGALVKDLFYYLIDEDNNFGKRPPSDAVLMSEGILAIVAGSDTTSVVLAGLFYFLLTHPDDYTRLRKEVDGAFPPGEGDPLEPSKLAEMSFLNAVINETMRLQPAVPTMLQRAPEAGSGGHWIGSRFIPEGIAVTVPPYALHTDPRYFSPSPEKFWPGRWLNVGKETSTSKQPFTTALSPPPQTNGSLNSETQLRHAEGEVITNTAAFIPFSFGPANCAGRNLALLEMRTVVALLMQRFEMRLADGYDSREWMEKLEDRFVMTHGRLPVVLTPRF